VVAHNEDHAFRATCHELFCDTHAPAPAIGSPRALQKKPSQFCFLHTAGSYLTIHAVESLSPARYHGYQFHHYAVDRLENGGCVFHRSPDKCVLPFVLRLAMQEPHLCVVAGRSHDTTLRFSRNAIEHPPQLSPTPDYYTANTTNEQRQSPSCRHCIVGCWWRCTLLVLFLVVVNSHQLNGPIPLRGDVPALDVVVVARHRKGSSVQDAKPTMSVGE
jgi:hypothetical protein